MTTVQSNAGTARYCPPEFFSDGKPSIEADVYAFGCVALGERDVGEPNPVLNRVLAQRF